MSTVIKNGTVVTADLSYKADVLIEGGQIIEIGMGLSGDEELDATGCYVMPGGIDPHVHLEMPFMGTYSSDDFESGTRAGLAGGTTMVVDFCLPNQGESLLDAIKRWDNKSTRANCDYSFHMAVTWWGEQVFNDMKTVIEQRGINTLLQAFEEIRRSLPSTRLLLAGRTSSDTQLIDPGVDYRGFVSQKEVPTLISACDVVVIPYTKDPLIDATNACKISEYLACGVPVVTTRVSNMAEIFPNTPQILAEPGNATSLSTAITFQLNNRIIFPLSHSRPWSELAKNVEATLAGLLERNASPKHHHN
jgi:hypothetical protein